MDDNDKHGVCGEIGLQSPDATNVIIQPTESDINPNSVPSMVSAHSGISADIPAYCTDNYKIRQNIKYEHEPLETTHGDLTRFNKIYQDCHPRSTSDGSRQGS